VTELNLAEYNEIGRIILIAIPAAAAILVPIAIGHVIFKSFVEYLQGLIDRLESLLVKLATGEELPVIVDD